MEKKGKKSQKIAEFSVVDEFHNPDSLVKQTVENIDQHQKHQIDYNWAGCLLAVGVERSTDGVCLQHHPDLEAKLARQLALVEVVANRR